MKHPSYVLFIDESGKSKFSDPGSHFLLSGLIIDKDLHTALSSYMISLKEKSKISPDENIHAFDLFESEKRRVRNASGALIYKRIPYPNVDTFFKRLSFLVDGSDMKCLVFCVNREPYQALIKNTALAHATTDAAVIGYLKRKNLHDFLYETLARKMILEFGHFLEEEGAHGEIMAESRRQDDEVVLRAFIAATRESTFRADSRYRAWAKNSLQRIHSITFQNKRGLSFGLEIADLFGWAHFNRKYGRTFPIASAAKIRRVESRINKIDLLMRDLYRKHPEDITRTKILTLASDRVSEFTEAISRFR